MSDYYDDQQQGKTMTPEERNEAEWTFYAENLNNQVRQNPLLERMYQEEGVDISDFTKGFKDPKTRRVTIALAQECEAEGGHRRAAKMAALNKRGVKDPTKLVAMTAPTKPSGPPKAKISQEQERNFLERRSQGKLQGGGEKDLVDLFLSPNDPIWKI